MSLDSSSNHDDVLSFFVLSVLMSCAVVVNGGSIELKNCQSCANIIEIKKLIALCFVLKSVNSIYYFSAMKIKL